MHTADRGLRRRFAPGLLLGVLLAAGGPARAAHDPQVTGAWRGLEGTLAGLVLTDRQPARFVASRAVVCVASPCPPLRMSGVWKTRGNRIVLRRGRGRALTYRYRVTADTLTLLRVRDDAVQAVLERVFTYCNDARDCAAQNYPRPRCIGEDICSPEHTCGWECGPGTESCDGFLCVDGEHCEIVDGGARCVGEVGACASTRCHVDQPHCVAVGNEVACLPPDECHRDKDCEGSKTCQPKVLCIRFPCFTPLVCR